MSEQFSFITANQIVFGVGSVKQLSSIVAKFGGRPMIIADPHIDMESDFLSQIIGNKSLFSPSGEPTVESIAEAVKQAKDFNADVIVGIGGGSSIDTAKAVGTLVANGGEASDYLEVIGSGKPLEPLSLPVVAVPTTAGTGAEVTANTPISSPEHGIKASLRSPSMLPDVAIVDPALSVSCPPSVTASSGLDALTQCLEPFTSIKANAFTNILAAEGLRRAGRSLRKAFAQGDNLQARTDMSMASLLGGMSLANAKLGSVHGLAAPLGGMLHAPHGMVCAAVLVACTKMNIHALQQRAPQSPALEAYREAMKLLTDNSNTTLDEGLVWLRETVNQLNVSGLSAMGMTPELVDHGASEALRASSMAGNPIQLTFDEVRTIILESM